MKKIVPQVLLLMFCSFLLGGLFGMLFTRGNARTQTGNSSVTGVSPTAEPILPTLTEERKEIIAQVETHEVSIGESKIDKGTISIKQHDQVKFVNNSGNRITVKGEGWGGLPLKPGFNLTQAFEEKGSYNYDVEPLGWKGTVMVE
jgi:plastocyanin